MVTKYGNIGYWAYTHLDYDKSLCSPLLVIFWLYIYERFFACFELMCTYSAKLSIQETNSKRMSSVEFVGTLKNSEESKNLWKTLFLRKVFLLLSIYLHIIKNEMDFCNVWKNKLPRIGPRKSSFIFLPIK